MNEQVNEWVKMESRRVQALLMRVKNPNQSSKKASIIQLLRTQPLARGIRFIGRCDNCHSMRYMSYTLPQFPRNLRERGGVLEEDCGYFCPNCKFGNAGSREVKRHE